MPTLSKTYTLTITPEQFLENCSDLELKELDLLIQMPRYARRMLEHQGKPHSSNSNQNQVGDCKNNNQTTEN